MARIIMSMASGQGKFGALFAIALLVTIGAGAWLGYQNRPQRIISQAAPDTQAPAPASIALAAETLPAPPITSLPRLVMGPFAPPRPGADAVLPPYHEAARADSDAGAEARRPEPSGGDTAGLPGATDPAPPAIQNLQPQTWARNAVAAPPNPGRLPVIAIVIDDVGIVPARAVAALALPAPMTMAILPYAREADQFSKKARAKGHEVLVHLPMEAENGVDPGPQALRTALTDAEFARRLRWNLSRFDGYIGLNNHMGSKLTQDSAVMGALMAEIKRRGLLFLDSRTATRTLAATTARSMGVTTLERDVFLDNVITPEAINRQLLKTEQTARQNGFAIAIGHPHAATIAALQEWTADLEARGFKLVPVSAITRSGPAPPVNRVVSLPHPGG